MAQRIYQSFRRIPVRLASYRKKPEKSEHVGSSCNISICSEYGFPTKPSCMAYDPLLDVLAILTLDGNMNIYGKPGVYFSASHPSDTEQFVQIQFIHGTYKLITLTSSDSIYLWELRQSTTSIELIQLHHLPNITANFIHDSDSAIQSDRTNQDDVVEKNTSVSFLFCSNDSKSIIFGTENGWIGTITVNTPPSGKSHSDFEYMNLSSPDNSISPQHIHSKLPVDRRQRLRLGAVNFVSERPESSPIQLLISYSSGLSLLYAPSKEEIVALLPWQHGVEAAAWCGGNGLPNTTTNGQPPVDLGNRLLTAHSDGSLGVWNLTLVSRSGLSNFSISPHNLTMEEKPCMPYGPFPCKVISKVYWLPSAYGGITAFVGGMPRANYGHRHTVSLLRGSKLDRAAAENLATARLRAALLSASTSNNDQSNDFYDDDEDEVDGRGGGGDWYAASNRPPPLHVFDTDAPEHVCFNLASRVIDALPVGPVGGPSQALLVLCDQELVVIDLATPNWPCMHSPYLTCLHTSTITACQLFTQVNPSFLAFLEEAGLQAESDDNPTDDWSRRTWPIQGLSMIAASDFRLSRSRLIESVKFTDDLLVTGHENGSIGFWRLGPGGCLARIYCLRSDFLFENENEIGVIVLQFTSNFPSLTPLQIDIKSELPGFKWKGFRPLKPRSDLDSFYATSRQLDQDTNDVNAITRSTHSPPQLRPIALALVQPPSRITALLGAELDSQTDVSGILVTLGTSHGYAMLHVSNQSPQLLLVDCTLPDNPDALNEAWAGEGWARRRTREMKRSLRDSFRRLKRVRSTKGPSSSVSQPPPIRSGTLTPAHTGGLVRKGGGGDESMDHPSSSNQAASNATLTTSNLGEREICDRPHESASTAVVTAITYGPPVGTSKHQVKSLGCIYVGTRAGMVFMHNLSLVGSSSSDKPLHLKVQRTRHLMMQHKAPVVKLQVFDSRQSPLEPLSQTSLTWTGSTDFKSSHHNPVPLLLVLSEEQVRLFALPNLRLKHKARVTAKDGYRIKGGQLVSMTTPCSPPQQHQSSPSMQLAFANSGGKLVLTNLPRLTTGDQLGLLNENNMVAVNSIKFAQPGQLEGDGVELGPTLGLYRPGPGQIILFDVAQMGQHSSHLGSSYRALYRANIKPDSSSSPRNPLNKSSNSTTANVDLSASMSPSFRHR